MKKSFRRAALLAITGAMLVGTAFTAKAESAYNGQWCVENNGYWFKLTQDGSKFLANTWYWIKDSDGIIRCYYFDHDGWLAANYTDGDNKTNDQGQWVVDGVVQTKKDSEIQYATHMDLSAQSKASAADTAAAAASVTASSTGEGPGAASTTEQNQKASSKTYYKASGAGDNPANATFTQAYQNSTISGNTVTNTWANFKMTFQTGVTPKTDDTGSGTDFYIDSDDTSNLVVTYYPLSKYNASNVDAFINGFLADARGYKGGTKANDITLGAYTFKQLTKAVSTPTGTTYDHAYVKAVDGTNFVMVISVEQNGNSEDYLSTLKTITKVR